MSRKGEPCNKFAANIFNKAKCQNCFRPREEHLLNDSDMSQAKVTACGWMYRAPDLIDFSNPAQRSRKWQRRWFVLFEHGGLVFSLDENPSTIPQGTINMNQCTEVYDGQGRTGKENCLAIVTPDSVDYVSTDNKFDIDRWYEVLVIYPRSKKMKNKRNFTIPSRKSDSPDAERSQEGVTTPTGQEKPSDEENKENQKDIPGQPEKEKDLETGTQREPLSPTTVTSQKDVQPPTILPQKSDKDAKNVNGDLKGQRKETNLERYNTMSSKQMDKKGSLGGSSRGTTKSQSLDEQQAKTPSEDSGGEERKAGTMYETFSSSDIRDARRNRRPSDPYAKIADVPKAKRYDAVDSGATSQDAEDEGGEEEEESSSEEEESSESEPEAPQEPVSAPPPLEKKPDSAASSPDKQRPKSLGVEDFEKLLGEKPKPILRLYDQLEALEPDWPREQAREGRSERRGRKESREEPPSMRRRNAAMQAAQRRARSLGPEVRYTDNISPELLNLKKGWLNVQGSTEKEWTKHWFVLSGHGLHYYKDAKAEEAGTYDGAIDLDTCYEVSEKTSQRNYGFLVKTHSGVYNLSAMTSGIRRNWIEAIRKVMPASLRPPSPDITKDAKPPPRREEQEMTPGREVPRRRAFLPDTEQMLYGDKPQGGVDAKKSGWQHPGRKRTREERPKTMDISVIRDQYRQRNRDSVHEQRSSDDMLRRPSASKTPLVTEPRRVATGPVPPAQPVEPPAEPDGRQREEAAGKEVVQRQEEEKQRLAEIERLKDETERRQAQTDSTLVELLETEVESLKGRLEKTQQDLVNVHEENVELKMQLAATRREHLQSYTEMESEQSTYLTQEQGRDQGDALALQAAILTEMAKSLEETPQGRVPSGKELQLKEFEDVLARIRHLEAVLKNEEVSGRAAVTQEDVPTVLDHVLQDCSSAPEDLQKYNEAKSQCQAQTADLLTELSRHDRFAELDLFNLVKSVAAGTVKRYSAETLSPSRHNKQPVSEKDVTDRLQAAKSDARHGQQQLSELLETYQTSRVTAIADAMARDVLQCANTTVANAPPVTVSLVGSAASQDMDARIQQEVANLETKRAAAKVLGRETIWSDVFLNLQQGCDAHLRKLHLEKQSSLYRFRSHGDWLEEKYSAVQKTLQEDVRVISEKLKQAFDAALDRIPSEVVTSGEMYSLRSVSQFADVVCNWAVVKAMSDHLGKRELGAAKPQQADASLRPSKLSGYLLERARDMVASAKDAQKQNLTGAPTTEQHRHVTMTIQWAVHQAESEYLSMYLRMEQERQASAFQQVFQDVRTSPSARTLESLAIEHSRNIIDTREKYESLLQRERQENTNQIAGMQEELETLRQTQMKKTHCDTCTSPIQIEGKAVSVDQEVKIQDMASRHKKEVSQLRDAHQKELDQVKTQLKMSQDDLQRRNKESIKEVDQLTELIETLKMQHEEETGQLREALAREIDSARDEVTRSFQKTVASVACSTDEETELVSGDVLRERLEELEQEWEEKLAAAKQAHEDDLEQVRNDMLTAVRFAQEAAKTDQESEELRKRVQELEEEIHQVEAEYEEALRRQKEEFERALHRSQAAGPPGKEHSKKYEEELDSIRAVSDQALSSLEDSHQRMLDDMKRAHQRELEKVEEQKETLLAEETAATIAAIEAMKKAHRDELVREVAKARMEAGQTSQDLEDIRQEHQKEIEALNREVEVLSKQFSGKCVEKSHLDQQVEMQTATIKEVQSKMQDLMQQNQELSARLTEEMKRVQRLESGGTREPSDGKETPNLYELQVSLRVKQSELQYLRQEVGSLKEELKSARRDQMHLAEKHQRLQLEYEGLRVRHDRQVASLHNQLRELQNLPEVVPEDEPVFVGAATTAPSSSARYSPSPGVSSSRYTTSATSPSAYDIQRSKSTPDFLTLPEAGTMTERHFSDDTEPIRVKLRRSKSLERGPRSGRVADRLRLFETP